MKKKLLLFYVLTFISSFGIINCLYAQETVPFSTRHEVNNIRGNVIMTGNDIVGALKQNGVNAYSDPNDAYDGTQNNGNYTTAFIDIDEDPTTFSSSSADLNAPDNDCSKLVYAGLYWSANYYMQRSQAPRNYTDEELGSGNDTNVNLTINNGDLAEEYNVRYSEFDNDNSDIRINPVTSYLVLAQPVSGCSITNVGMLAGNIAVISDGGDCSLREKVVNAQNAGAVGVVIVSDTDMMPRLTGDGPAINIPAVSIGNDDITNRTVTGGDLITLMQSNTEVILATLSTEGNPILNGLPLIDPRKQGPADFRNIRLKTPNANDYIDVTASSVVFDGYRNTLTNPLDTANDEVPYVCYADITGLLDPENPFGTYTVADMNATQGFTPGSDGACGGWFIVAIYENPNDEARYISTNDGFAQIFSGGNPVDFTYNGFSTPLGNQPVDARYGVATLEGDTSLGGDQLRIQNTSGSLIALGGSGASINPSGNFFNGSITNNEVYITTRVPASQNTQGFDMDIFDLDNDGNSLIGNGQSNARFQMATNQDRFSVFFNTLSVSLGNQPKLQVIERIYDVNGVTDITGQQVDAGDELLFDLEIENTGNENFVDGSVVVTAVLNDNLSLISVQDATLPPGISYVEVSSGVLEFYIPAAIVEANIDGPLHVRFKTQLAATCQDLRDTCSDTIKNSTAASYTGAETGLVAHTVSDSAIDSCGRGNGQPAYVTFDFPICQQNVTSCYGNLTLVAATGYNQYTWSGPGITTPVVTSVSYFDVPNPQSGAYSVTKEDTDPSDGSCVTLIEEFIVTTQGDGNLTNPILDYVNGTSVTSDDCSGLEIPTIHLCDGDTFLLETNFNNLASISWQKLIPSGACISDPNDPCSLLSGDCTDVNWLEQPDGNALNFTVSDTGDYRILVELNEGCFIPFYFGVYKNDYSPELTMNPIECGNDGRVTVTNAPDNFAFSLTQGGPYNNTSGIFDIDTSGDITIYAANSNNPVCEFSATIYVPSIDPQFSISALNNGCSNGANSGSITIAVTDGLPEYQYTISSPALGAADPVIVSSNNGNYILDNLSPGTYEVEVISNYPVSNCVFTETVVINPASSISIGSSSVTDISCNFNGNALGSIEIFEVTGGNPPYTYSLFKDNNLANTSSQNPTGPTTDTSINFQDLNFGNYLLRITDANNCNVDYPFEIKFVSSLSAEITGDNSCSEGFSLDISMNGGIGPFEIREYPNGTYVPFNGLPISSGSRNERNHQFTGITGGNTFVFEVVDLSTGCTEVKEVNLPELTGDLSIFTGVNNPNCAFDYGSILVSVSGVSSEFTYNLYNVNNELINSLTSNNVTVEFDNVLAGDYNVEVFSNNGDCATTTQVSIIEPQDLYVVAEVLTDALCYGTDSGAAAANVFGGTPPYNFTISSESGIINSDVNEGVQGQYIFPNLLAGTYDIYTQDANGCDFFSNIVISEPERLFVGAITTPSSVFVADGSIEVNVTGGVGPFEYAIRDVNGQIVFPFQTGNLFNGLSAGDYTVVVMDNNICQEEIIVTVNEDQANPLVEYADEILTCAITGVVYPVVYIEDEFGVPVEINWGETISIVWQKLDDITCDIELVENCPTTDSSCESSWFEVGSGNSYTALEEGQYRVIIEFANRIMNSTRTYYFRVEDQTLSTDDLNQKDFSFYPNPADSFIVLSETISNIEVYDVTGKKVLAQSVVKELDISSLNNGVYFLKMKSSDGTELIKKLIKN